MNLIKTKDLYQQACQQSNDLHAISDDERVILQNHLIKMYKEIESVCIKHNLTVMLAYGSVLGAIRHGGFIPWDDDMDLFMPRKDYELFIHRYSCELPGNLKVYAPNTKNKAISRFAKVVDTETKFLEAEADDMDEPSQGVFVDIFPLDSINNNSVQNKLKRYILMILMYIGSSVRQYNLNFCRYKKLMSTSMPAKINYWLRHALGFCFSFWNFHKWYNIIDNYCRCDLNTGYVADLLGTYEWKPIPNDVFLPPQKGVFENMSVFLSNDPKKHLKIRYGNWHELPPESDRWQHYVNLLKINQWEGTSD